MVEAIVKGKAKLMAVSTYLDGEYDHKDICIGVPVMFGPKGVEKIVEIEIEPETKKQFDDAVKHIRDTTSVLLI